MDARAVAVDAGGNAYATSGPSPTPGAAATTRVITYGYDGLQRLIGAVENPGTTFAYAYDLACNRTDVWTNGGLTAHQDYNAANQVSGFTYDAAGNLTSEGWITYTYDTLNRMTAHSDTTATYNGAGVLVDDARPDIPRSGCRATLHS